jgi:hypothetical protein
MRTTKRVGVKLSKAGMAGDMDGWRGSQPGPEEMTEFHRLHAASLELHMMPGHGAAAIGSFEKNGLLVKGF